MLATATMMSGSISFRCDQTLRSFIDSPLDAGKRSGSVENVLAVVQIQNRVTSSMKNGDNREANRREYRVDFRESGLKRAM